MTDYHLKAETGRFRVSFGKDSNINEILERLINSVPYVIFVVILLSVFIFIWKGLISYDQFIDLLKILIWPTVVLCSFIFFKKVFTYLFLSMEEFNFFGAKGNLRNIEEVIEERVQMKLEEEEENKRRNLALQELEKNLKEVTLSKDDYQKLVKNVSEQYHEIFNDKEKILKELTILKQEKEGEERRKEYRHLALRRAMDNARRHPNYADQPSEEEIDTAGDTWMQQELDRHRGK